MRLPPRARTSSKSTVGFLPSSGSSADFVFSFLFCDFCRSVEQKLCLPFWKSRVSVNLMVEKVEKSALSLRLYGEDITPHAPTTKSREERRTAAVAKAEAEAKAANGEGEAADAAVVKDEEAAVAVEEAVADAGAADVAEVEMEAKVEV